MRMATDYWDTNSMLADADMHMTTLHVTENAFSSSMQETEAGGSSVQCQLRHMYITCLDMYIKTLSQAKQNKNPEKANNRDV